MNGFTNTERGSFRAVIVNYTIEAMQDILLAAQRLSIPLPQIQAVDRILNNTRDGRFNQEIAKDVHDLWADSRIQEICNKHHVLDSATYFFKSIDKFLDEKYLPDNQDILRVRVRSTGVCETKFKMDDADIRLIDVGGQKSERKKWLNCFEGVTAVLFCVALSEYDQTMFEDDSTNRMTDSLQLFDQICNNKWFTKSAMILFLNKRDLFELKIKTKDLKVCFPDYDGGNNFEKATKYITNKFTGLKKTNRLIYTHITCATDTENIAVVWAALKDIILSNSLKELGIEGI